MEQDGIISRTVRGKRCFTIELSDPTTVTGPTVDEPTPAPEEPHDDTADLAQALLGAVIDILAQPARTDTRIADLERTVHDLNTRVYELTERSERLRQRNRLLEDTVAAKNVEADGLRQRLNAAERNLEAIIANPQRMRLDDQRERELREIVRLMRAPRAKAS